MEKILKIFSKEYGNINQAALLLGSFAFLSQILGLLRDRSLAHFIGPGATLDVYYAAFRIPDLIFVSVIPLASITVLIPFITSKMKGEEITEEAKKFLNDIFTVFFFILVSISVIIFFAMPYLIHLITPGFSSEMQMEAMKLSRIMLLSPIFLGLSNLFSAVTQLFRRFLFHSLGPVFYNLGIIIGVLALYPMMGLSGLAFGVVLGALMHYLIQVFASYGYELRPRFSRFINFSDVKKVALLSVPRTLGISLNNIALILIIALASFLKDGSISIFNLSLNLQSVPLGIIGVSYAVASFPVLARSFSSGKLDEFKKSLKSSARAIVFWSLPVTFLFIVLRAQIVRVVLGSGELFSWEHTRLVAAALAVFSVSIVAQGLIALLARAYYAGGNTRKPLFINLFASTCIVLFSYLFINIFNNFPYFRYFIESILKVSDLPGTEMLMLPLAYSLGTILNLILLWRSIKRDFMPNEFFLRTTFFQSLGASFFLGLIAYISLNFLAPILNTNTFWGIFFQGLISGILGIIAGIIVLYLLGSEELKDLGNTLKTKFWKAKVITPIQEGL